MATVLIMPHIYHSFTVNAPAARVFDMFATPAGLDQWWTKHSQGTPEVGAVYSFGFGPGYLWKGVVTVCIENIALEWQMTDADADWQGTKVGATLQEKKNGITQVDFYHTGWPLNNEHYKISCYCWAMYLRILKRYAEFGEEVPYEKRLKV